MFSLLRPLPATTLEKMYIFPNFVYHKIEGLEKLIIRITKLLQSKSIGFCLYRFPSETSFRLAIDRAYLPHDEGVLFQVSPFSSSFHAVSISLSVVNTEFITEAFLKTLSSVPKKKKFSLDLPKETSRSEYFERIDKYLKDIRGGKLDKAILSRVVTVTRPHNFDVVDHFVELSASYSQAFTYLLSHPYSGVWLGATPELLLRQQQEEIFTIALAGTQKKKEQGGYYWREKEIEEHEWVARHIEQVMEEESYVLADKKAHKTIESGPVAHLETAYVFRAEDRKQDINALVQKLHPTPAIGGWPVTESLACIQAYEGYDRRYYAGVLGEVDKSGQHSHLFVNLRCMQVGKDKIAIYVGGGITAASDPEEEWEETCVKSRTMREKIRAIRKQ